MNTWQESTSADEVALQTLIRSAVQTVEAGERLEKGGGGTVLVRVPAPSNLIRDGRRVRSRRRRTAGALAVAASLLVVGAGIGVGSGAWQLPIPSLRGERQDTGPATLDASRGTQVGDVVNAMDTAFGSYDVINDDVWFYASGPNVAGALRAAQQDVEVYTPRYLREHRMDRMLRLTRVPGAADKTSVSLSTVEPGSRTALEPSTTLAVLDLGGGRGTWSLIHPSDDDGWLLLAALPAGAEAVQFRVSGTRDFLPLEFAQTGDGSRCRPLQPGDEPNNQADAEAGMVCKGMATGPFVRVRFAIDRSRQPVDGISYIDQDGRYVILGVEAQR
jgi:hypothetical protein